MNYDVVRTAANNAYSNYKENTNNFNKSMSNFYKEGIKNPSVAKTIMMTDVVRPNIFKRLEDNNNIKDIIKRAGHTYKSLCSIFIMNEDIGKEQKAKENFDKKYNKLYPKTGEIRENIQRFGQVVMDKIMPKSHEITKYRIKAETNNYLEKYPKTFLIRRELFFGKRIDKNYVKPKMSLLQKLKYKDLFKK